MPPITFQAFKTVFQIGPKGIAAFKATGEHNVYEAIARQRRKVLAGEALAVKRILGAWKVAQAGIEAKLAAVTEQIAQATASGEPVSPAWLYQQERWTEFLQTIAAEVEKYAQVAEGVTQSQQAAGVKNGTADAKALVVDAGVKTGFKTLPKGAFEDLVGALTDKSPLHDLFAKIAPDAVAKARTIFAQEVAAGQHPTVIAARFRKEIGLERERALLIARTESIRAYTTAVQRNYEANADVVVASRIVSSRDARTCPLCLARDGKILKHGEPFARHPGCRCALAPVVKYLDVDRGTGEEWLKTQSEEFQEETLGPARYKLWKAGQITLNDLVEEVDHPRWGIGIRGRNLDTIGKQIALGATGSTIVTKVPGMGLIATASPASFPPKKSPAPSAPVPKVEAPESAAGGPQSTFPKPTGKKANEYADQLVADVAAGKLVATPGEMLAAIKQAYPKSILEEVHLTAKLKKVGIAPADLGASHSPEPVAPAPVVSVQPSGVVKVLTGADLAAKFPGPASDKTGPANYQEMLVKKVGPDLTPDEFAALVKHYFPATKVTPESVLKYYVAKGTTPKGGFPADFVPGVPKPAAPKPPKASKPEANAADVILDKQVGQQAGSNDGGLYLGADGKQRYVKFYNDPSQAHGEHLANEIYRMLDIQAPTSTLFDASAHPSGRGKSVAFASDILPIEGTVGKLGLTEDVAKEILRGFAADVLTGNWDAVGMGLDNVVILKGGGVARIDQGGSFLFRAKNGKKPDAVLDDIPEWDGFAPGGINPDYAKVFAKAGVASADDLGKELQAQVRAIVALRKKLGGWEAFVKSRTPGMATADQARIVRMLDARTDLLEARAAKIGKPPKALKVPMGGVSPKTLNPRVLSEAEGRKKRQALYAKPYTTYTDAEKAALANYKNGSYRAMNAFMRGTAKTLDAKLKGEIELIKSMFRKSVPFDEDIQLYRGVGFKAWWDLQPGDEGTILKDHSFLSTANAERVSRYFAMSHGLSGDPYHPVLLRIKAARGTYAIPSRNPSASDGEHEFIVDHANYRVVAITKETQGDGRILTILDVEMIESQEGQTTWNRKIK